MIRRITTGLGRLSSNGGGRSSESGNKLFEWKLPQYVQSFILFLGVTCYQRINAPQVISRQIQISVIGYSSKAQTTYNVVWEEVRSCCPWLIALFILLMVTLPRNSIKY